MKFITVLTFTIIAGWSVLNDLAVAQVAEPAQICSDQVVAQRSCARDSVTAVAAVVAASDSPAKAFQTAIAYLNAEGSSGRSFANQLVDFFQFAGGRSKPGRPSNASTNRMSFVASCMALVKALCPKSVRRCTAKREGKKKIYTCTVGGSSGLECNDTNCNEDHPPRCVVKESSYGLLPPRKVGTCTVDYFDYEVKSGDIGANCSADDDCKAIPVCFQGKCVPQFAVPNKEEVGPVCKKSYSEEGDKSCSQKEKRCVYDSKNQTSTCTEGGPPGQPSYLNTFCTQHEDCRSSQKFCGPGNTGRCAKRELPYADGKVCLNDESCEDRSWYYCDGEGGCGRFNEIQKGRIPCDPGEIDDICKLRVCRDGACKPVVEEKNLWGTTTCDPTTNCSLERGCSDGRCISMGYQPPFPCGLKGENDCESEQRPKSCGSDGACKISEFSMDTCDNHKECLHRRYPDFCEKSPNDPGCTETSFADCENLPPNQRDKVPHCQMADMRFTPLEAAPTTMMARLSTNAIEQHGQESNAHATAEQAIKPAVVVKRLRGTKPSHVWGKANAKVTLAIFQDLSCGQCKRVHRESFAELAQSFIDTGKLKVEFYEFPLIMGKDVARHYGALCAGRQGKYVQFVKKVYENFKEYDVKDQARYAKTVEGLDLEQWNKCMSKTDSLASIIKSHKEVGASVGVDGTPTLFLNGEGVSNFREVLIPSVAKLAQ